MADRHSKLKKRDLYLHRLAAFQDTEPVKIITGIRRCGKSSLLKLMIQHLRKQGIEETQLIVTNFEFMEFRGIDAVALYRLVKENVSFY